MRYYKTAVKCKVAVALCTRVRTTVVFSKLNFKISLLVRTRVQSIAFERQNYPVEAPQTSQEYFRLQCLISKPSWCCRQKPPKAQKPPGAARSPQEPPGVTRSRQATSSYQEPARATQGSPRVTRQPGATRRLADNRLLLLQYSVPHPKHFPQYNCMFFPAPG